MRKVITGILMVASLGAYAAPVVKHVLTQKQTDEIGELFWQHSHQQITNVKYKERLTACSDSGNLACTAQLGHQLNTTQEYRKAYPLLMRSKGGMILAGSTSEPFPASEGALGDMFVWGHGVMQNTDKALQHYRVGALFGDTDCAIGMITRANA